ncbi:MAG: hypothetical protein KDB03_18755 [Planctomycetales bacterium]|nr:hypothetical protein [Planctomycetales bacterium]
MNQLLPTESVQHLNDGIRTKPSTLSSGQLTMLFIVVTLVPFSLVVTMYFMLPTGDDPVLEAEVIVGPRAWPNDKAQNARLVPCVTITNPTSDEWDNLNMAVNDMFFYYHPEPLEAGESMFVPLKFFHTKGNQNFPPESQPLTELTVYAQIPSGARAILKIDDPQQLQLRSAPTD